MEDLIPQLEPLLASADPAAGFDFLIGQFLDSKDYGLVFEARLMKKRYEMGLPLIQTSSLDRDDYQQAVVEIARETGRLFLEDGKIERAWPYFRAVSEPGPIYEAIDKIEGGENAEGIVSIAFQEG